MYMLPIADVENAVKPYIDPGTGFIIIQVVSAGILGVLIFVTRIRDAILSFFRRLLSNKKGKN